MVSACDVVLVPYVDDVTVMRVLLFVLHVCMLRGYDGDGNGVVVAGGGVVAGCEYIGGMSLNCAPTRVCRKSASRPGYVVKVRTDPGYVVKQCPRIVMNKIFDWH